MAAAHNTTPTMNGKRRRPMRSDNQPNSGAPTPQPINNVEVTAAAAVRSIPCVASR